MPYNNELRTDSKGTLDFLQIMVLNDKETSPSKLTCATLDTDSSSLRVCEQAAMLAGGRREGGGEHSVCLTFFPEPFELLIAVVKLALFAIY